MKKYLVILFFGIFATLQIAAGQNRFQMGLIGGLNFSTLEGNTITDYYGINAGLLGTIKLTENKQIGIELLYSQNGEYLSPFYPPVSYGTIRLNHIEIPVHIDWLLKKEKTDINYTGQLQFGLAYTKLLNHYIEDDRGTNLTDQVLYTDTDAIVVQGGVSYFFTDQVGINLRATHSLNAALFWSLSARIVYLL